MTPASAPAVARTAGGESRSRHATVAKARKTAGWLLGHEVPRGRWISRRKRSSEAAGRDAEGDAMLDDERGRGGRGEEPPPDDGTTLRASAAAERRADEEHLHALARARRVRVAKVAVALAIVIVLVVFVIANAKPVP